MENRIDRVTSSRDWREFIMLPWRIYHGSKYWVPPLISQEKKQFDRKRNPFFKHAEVEFFLARRGSEPVGRIAAIVNHNHNRFHGDRVGFFGFFECIEDFDVARQLLDAAKEFLRKHDLDVMRGPMNYSTNETCGLLIEGFDVPPCVMMPYNSPYYAALLERYGFVKAKDLYAYAMKQEQWVERISEIARRIERRAGVRVRPLRKGRFWEDVHAVQRVYNSAWEANWGFVPMTDAEFLHMAKDMKQIVDPHLCLLAEANGEVVGFALALPNINQALAKLNGRLFPFGLIKLLWYSRKIYQARIITLGVVKEYRGRGIDLLLYTRLFEDGTQRGYCEGEFSWILEDNHVMNRALNEMGAHRSKTYRIFDSVMTD